jgi:hypothetical protein
MIDGARRVVTIVKRSRKWVELWGERFVSKHSTIWNKHHLAPRVFHVLEAACLTNKSTEVVEQAPAAIVCCYAAKLQRY